ncbi:hypothetical protein HKD37_08G021871 [Glycine soja]
MIGHEYLIGQVFHVQCYTVNRAWHHLEHQAAVAPCSIGDMEISQILKEKSNMDSTSDASTYYQSETHDDHVFKPKEDKDNANEVFSMDYTPARRKPPIHNLN